MRTGETNQSAEARTLHFLWGTVSVSEEVMASGFNPIEWRTRQLCSNQPVGMPSKDYPLARAYPPVHIRLLSPTSYDNAEVQYAYRKGDDGETFLDIPVPMLHGNPLTESEKLECIEYACNGVELFYALALTGLSRVVKNTSLLLSGSPSLPHQSELPTLIDMIMGDMREVFVVQGGADNAS